MTIVHGGNIINTAQEIGCRPDELIDMSSNLSPFGMPAGLVEVLKAGLPVPSGEGVERLVEIAIERNIVSVSYLSRLEAEERTDLVFARLAQRRASLRIMISFFFPADTRTRLGASG